MNASWSEFFTAALAAADASGVKRQRGGGQLSRAIDFGSNDYLGLRDHPAVRAAMQTALSEAGWGSGASPVLNGYHPLHTALERALAEHCHGAAAVVFSSGYACNLGSLACLADEADAIYSDQLNHASLIDGIRLSKAARKIYPHGDVGFLENDLRLHRHRYRRVLIVSETIFSMDGDQADLLALADVAQRFACGLVIDEAHATGVYGADGGGLWQQLTSADSAAANQQVVLKLGTLSKALGSIGGFAVGSQPAIEFLVNRCRSYLFSTAPPPASMAATLAALGELRQMGPARIQLRTTSTELRQRLSAAGWQVPAGDSPIIPLIVGDERATLQLSAHLAAHHLYVPAIRPPTVPPGTSRLRISLSTRHTTADIDTLLHRLGSPAQW